MGNEEKTAKNIEKAQDRKDLSIGYFNATNSAIEMVKLAVQISPLAAPKDAEGLQHSLSFWRDWFIEEHKKYRAQVLLNFGATFSPQSAMDKLSKAKNIVQLRNVWLSLTEDERRDEVVENHKNKLKEQYENIQ